MHVFPMTYYMCLFGFSTSRTHKSYYPLLKFSSLHVNHATTTVCAELNVRYWGVLQWHSVYDKLYENQSTDQKLKREPHTNNKHKNTENVVDLPLKEESGLQSATGTCHFKCLCMLCRNASTKKKCMWLVLWHIWHEKWLVQVEGRTFNTIPITESHPHITYPSTDNHTQLVFTKENRRL
jgi:hypothetical protein